MATIPISVPDAVAARVNTALAKRWGYPEEVPDPNNPGSMMANPESKLEFNKRHIARWIKMEAVDQESVDAGRTASDTQRQDSETELDIQPG